MGRRKKFNNGTTAMCNRCHKEKSLDDFYKNNAHGNGKTNRCKTCIKEVESKKNHTLKNICAKCGQPTFRKKYCSWECYRTRNLKTAPDGTIEKRCTKCGIFQPLIEFHNSTKNKINLNKSSRCKTCGSLYSKSPNGRAAFQRSKLKRKEYIKLQSYKYCRRLDVKQRKRVREYLRRKTDPVFALKNRVRGLMYHSLRKTKNGRKWEELVGYSVEALRKHIERQFKDGMSWDRFLSGEIHIDHKIPVSAFNFTKPEDIDFKRCWSLKNLQPLWAVDNLKKNAKLEHPFQPSLRMSL